MQTLFIVGPTSTGKTDLCVSLIPTLLTLPGISGVDILSADSKHVYIGEDIVTGKDTSTLLSLCDQYPDRVNLFGIDMVKPDEAWSVSHFLKLATEVVAHATAQHRLLIIVGGTALYLHSLLNPPATAVVPRNDVLRSEIESLSTSELQSRLQEIDAEKYAQMNHSDQLNPRRLVRAIEVATWKAIHHETTVSSSATTGQFEPSLWIGLNAEKDVLTTRIRERVKKRLAQGAVKELIHLHEQYPHWTKEAYSAIGYADLETYIDDDSTQEEVINAWTTHEVQYVKKQMTWFKTMSQIEWVDVSTSVPKEHILKMVSTWYTGL